MTQVLHAWVCDAYMGRFERVGSQTQVTFAYDSQAPTDISLSLPRDEEAAGNAAGYFLAGLIPEHPGAREIIRQITGAKGDSAWDLLEAIGGDLPGGLVLRGDQTETGENVSYLWAASESEIVDRIAQIHRGGSGFSSEGPPPRFSVAGAQAKFTLAHTDFGTFWPDRATVSSHIVKPEVPAHAGLERIEAATLRLANLSGLNAPHAEQVVFGETTAFQVERFDREMGADGQLRRVHAEDFTQALGMDPADKELVGPDQIATILRRATGDDELGHDFYRQLAFNTLIGNSDAHGKNYSILYKGDQLEVSPLYDSFPMGFFPTYARELTMPIGNENRFKHVTPENWAQSAAESGLEVDRVLADVHSVAEDISKHLDETLGEEAQLSSTRLVLDEIREAIDRNTGAIPAAHLQARIVDFGSSRTAPGSGI